MGSFLTVLLVVLATIPGPGRGPAGESGPTGPQLLDKYLDAFKSTAKTDYSDRDFEAAFGPVVAEARSARAGGAIDGIWFRRFMRLMAITRLLSFQSDEIMGPVAWRSINELVEEKIDPARLGRPVTGGEVSQIHARALAEEWVDLRLYLETMPRRTVLLKELASRWPNLRDEMSQPRK